MSLTFSTTTRWALRKLVGANLVSDIDAGFAALADDIDPKLTPHTSGALGARPTSTVGTPGIEGRTFRDTATGIVYLDTGTSWLALNPPEAAGTLKATAASAAPSGYLLCDGAAVSRSTFAGLFAAIGTAYGAGNGTTTFNIPTIVGRFPMGADPTDASTAPGHTAHALGASGGEETHVLTVAELAAHTHTIQVSSSGAGGVTNPPVRSSGVNDAPLPGGGLSTGGNNAHNNLPPFTTVNWIIKT